MSSNDSHYSRCSFGKSVITSFAQRDKAIGNDSGDYVFELDVSSDNSSFVSAISDNSLLLYDTPSLRVISRVPAHRDSISAVEYAHQSPHIFYSASCDGYVYRWDSRVMTAPSLSLSHSDEVSAISLGMNDTLLSVGFGSNILFYDVRVGDSSSSTSISTQSRTRLLGEYGDAHSDMITALEFSSTDSNILTSASEDGLICCFNTSTAAQDEAVVSILNTETPVRRIGYFGANSEGIYAVSTIETLSVWHYPSAQRLSTFPMLKEQLGVDYLVDCVYESDRNTLLLVAGAHDGTGCLARVEPASCERVGLINNGHSADIRCCRALHKTPGLTDTDIGSQSGGSNSSSMAAGMPWLLTGGEDSRICSWHMYPSEPFNCSTAGQGSRIGISGASRGAGEGIKATRVVGGASKGGSSHNSALHHKPY